MIKKSCVVLAVLCSLVLLPAASQGVVHNFNFLIDGPQANAGAGTGSTATGVGTATLDTNTNLFSWNLSWSGLSGPATAAHFHGPAPPNQNAGVTVNFGAISGLTSPSIGNTVITGGQATDLLNHLWYVNFHTSQFPAGEIRGQVVPEPLTLSLLGLGSAILIRRRQRRNR